MLRSVHGGCRAGATLFNVGALRNRSIVKNATHTTHCHFIRAPFTSNTLLRFSVRTTPIIFIFRAKYTDVAILSPASSPGILNFPILVPRIITIAYSEDSMTKNGILLTRVKDACSVIVPSASIDCNYSRALVVHCLFQRVTLVAWQHVPTRNF